MNSQIREYSKIVESIYDAALDPTKWPLVLASITRYMSSERGILHTPFLSNSEGRVAFSIGISDVWLQRYGDQYHKIDPWNHTAVERGFAYDGNVFLGEDLIPTKQLLKSAFYNEFLAFSDVVHNCIGVVFGQNSTHGPTTAISCFRGKMAPRYHATDKARLSPLVSHLSKAIGVQYRLMGAELQLAASLAALDRLTHGVVLVNEKHKVTHINAYAHSIIARNDGLLVNTSTGELQCLSPHDACNLQRAIVAAGEINIQVERHFSDAVLVTRRHCVHPYIVHVSSLPTSNNFSRELSRATTIVFISSADDLQRASHEHLATLFGLTKAELALADALLAGKSLRGYASVRNLSYETVRTHLRSLFAKTKTTRQTELLRLLISSAGIFRDGK